MDYVFSGEGDEGFSRFCDDLLRQRRGEIDWFDPPCGFLTPDREGREVPVVRVTDLENLPPPNFRDCLEKEYGITRAYFTESIIDMGIFRDFLPPLAARKEPLS